MSKFILWNNTDIFGLYDNLEHVSSIMLDNIINYLTVYVEFKKLNDKINFPDFTFKIDEIKENNTKENILTYNLINDNIELLYSLNNSNNKMSQIVHLYSKISDNNILETILNNKNNDYNIFEEATSDDSDVSSDTSELNDSSDESLNLVFENNDDEIVLIEDNNQKNDIIDQQRQKIEDLLNKKNMLENKKKKEKEKEEEIERRFDVDYDVYMKLKNKYTLDNVPDIFKYKYIIFNKIEKNNLLEDKIKAKEFYKNNFNVINKNIGSSIFNNIFNQKEPEEDLIDSENSGHILDNIKELSDSDESINNGNIQSEDILLH